MANRTTIVTVSLAMGLLSAVPAMAFAQAGQGQTGQQHGTSGQAQQGQTAQPGQGAEHEEATEKNEHDIALGRVPAAPRKTLEAEGKGGKVEEVETFTRNGQTFYEAEIVKNGQKTEIEVDAKGNVVRRGAPEKGEGAHEGK